VFGERKSPSKSCPFPPSPTIVVPLFAIFDHFKGGEDVLAPVVHSCFDLRLGNDVRLQGIGKHEAKRQPSLQASPLCTL
jgi:hypothetical protein